MSWRRGHNFSELTGICIMLYTKEKKRVGGKKRNPYIQTLKIIAYFPAVLCLQLAVTKMDVHGYLTWQYLYFQKHNLY